MKIETTRYRLPIDWVCPLINDDFSGCNDEEENEIKSFLEDIDGYPVDVDYETEGFYRSNDANSLGGTCVDVIFRMNNQ